MLQRVNKVEPPKKEAKGWAHCPMCTHTVPANIVLVGRKAKVAPNQKCPRCQGALDAGFVLNYDIAA
jgi:hypothetical protein